LKNNIFIVDIPGYGKNDVKIYENDDIISIKLKDDDIIIKYQIPKLKLVESVKCINGQLIFKLKDKDNTKEIIVE
jgi:hypothetical protein